MARYDAIMNLFYSKTTENYYGSLWKHFPQLDRKLASMVTAHIDFQREVDSDIVKISPHAGYSVTDFGCEISDETDPITGASRCKKCAISTVKDWEIDSVDLQSGDYGLQLEAAKQIVANYREKIPTMFTIFSPMYTASKMDSNFLLHLDQEPKIVKEGLNIICKLTEEYIAMILELGVDAIFLATQHSNPHTLPITLFKKLELPFLKRFHQIIYRKNGITVVHLHGTDVYLKQIATELQPAAISMHTSTIDETVAALNAFPGILLGGIDEQTQLLNSQEEQLEKSIISILELVSNNRLILAPGCVIPQNIPHSTLQKVIGLVHAFNQE